MRAAVFLDRDGVINVDGGHTHRVEDFAFVPCADAAIRLAHEAGFPVFIVTNQGGIGLGLYDEETMQRFHRHLQAEVAATGGHIADIAFCPHHPQALSPMMRECDCRKPKPGMLLALAERHGIALERSVMIGDRETDMEAAQAAGCHGLKYHGDNLLGLMETALAWIAERKPNP